MQLLALAVFGLAASAYLPIRLAGSASLVASLPFTVLPILLVVAGYVLAYTLAGSMKPIIPYPIISVLLLFALGDPSLATLPSILFVSTVLLAYLCRTYSSWWLLLSGGGAYLLSFLITKDPVTSLYAIFPIIPAFVLFISHKRGAHRVCAVVRVSLCYGLGIAVPMALLLLFLSLNETGSISLEPIRELFSELRAGITDALSSALYELYSQMPEVNISAADMHLVTKSSVNLVFNYLPAILTISTFVTAYIAHSLYIAVIVPTTEDQNEIKNALTFKMSLASAIVFIAAFLFSAALEYDGHELYATALSNLYIIFVPAFTMIAFGFVGAFIKGEGASCFGYLIYISLFLMLFRRPDIVFPLASFAGAMVVIIASIKERRRNKKDGTDI